MRHRRLEVIHQDRNEGQVGVDPCAPERDACAVVEFEPMRQCRLEVVVERRLQQVMPECGMPLEHTMWIHLLHEGLRRTLVLVANSDADRRQIVDEEIDPMIR
jgi:hypothetical protein